LVDFYGLPARYANATYIAASKVDVLEQVEKELLQLRQSSKTSAKFHEFLNNPLIPRSEKAKVVGTMKDKLSSITVNLLTTLAGNARLSILNKIVETYSQLMKAKRGQVEAVIITADPLTKTQEEAVAAAMKAQFLASRGSVTNVVITTQVDPSILGGLQVKMGDQFLDLSVKSRIDELAQTPV
jgi:F-type H+-transporting ATPase subunit O